MDASFRIIHQTADRNQQSLPLPEPRSRSAVIDPGQPRLPVRLRGQCSGNRGRDDLRAYLNHQGQFPVFWWRRIVALVVVLALPAIHHGQVIGDPIQSGSAALRGAGDFPWYDADSDRLRRVDVAVEPPPQHSEATWEIPELQTPQPNVNFSFLGDLLQLLGWALLIALIVAIVYFLVNAHRNRDAALALSGSNEVRQTVVTDRQRIESLPFQLREMKRDFLTMADELYRSGDYNEAIIYLFSYQLLQLDRANLIRLTRGKTNRQYVRELGSRTAIRRIMLHTIRSFEEVFFGHHSLDKQRFEVSWNALDEFNQLLQQDAG